MTTRIKLKRGTGSPAGSLEQYEVAMDVAASTLYTSTDGVDAVVLANNYTDTDAVSAIESATLDLENQLGLDENLTFSANAGDRLYDVAFTNQSFNNFGAFGKPGYTANQRIELSAPNTESGTGLLAVQYGARVNFTDTDKDLGTMTFVYLPDLSVTQYEVLVRDASNNNRTMIRCVPDDGVQISPNNAGFMSTPEVRVATGNLIVNASEIDFTALPTSDPAVAGRLWNDAGTVKISAG